MPPIVVFDLDGTLVDTAPDLIASLNAALAREGMAAVDVDAFRPFAGRGGRVMIETAYARAGRPLGEPLFSALHATFVDHYRESMPGTSRLFDGGLGALDRLAADGWALAICTNKPEDLALRLIDRMGLTARFAAIAGSDTYPYKKPDPRHLLSTIDRAGGDPERAVMVGDTVTDIDAAKAAGVPVVGVDFGYSDTPVLSLEPSAAIGHFDALTPELLRRLLS
ncbi:MAG: phosphoglycolate phosphatase [Phyllobacteriaceae bacterium]|nr:phosphoglycolate phosphatase [Phyllobacteriaceae bacterium]